MDSTFFYSGDRLPVAGDIPDGTTILLFGDTFNQPLNKGVLPNTVTGISFGIGYNQKIKPGVLPYRLKNLHFFGSNYNHTIGKHVLPHHLEELVLRDNYNKPFKLGVLDHLINLVYLDLGPSYNQDIAPHTLPPRLKMLILGKNFNKPLDSNNIPHSLEYLEIESTNYTYPLDFLISYPNIQSVYVNPRQKNLSEHLKIVNFNKKMMAVELTKYLLSKIN